MDLSLADFSVHGILQARILVWVAVPFSKGSIKLVSPMSPALASEFFTTNATWKAPSLIVDLNK